MIISAVILLTLITGIVVVRKTYSDNLRARSTSEKSQLITIPEGATVQEIANLLEDHAVIKAGWAFEWYVRNTDARDKLQAGTYALKPSDSVEQLVNILTGGHIATDLITILPGRRIDEIHDDLINDGFDAAKVEAALNPALYSGHPALVDKPAAASLEGYLYPESFQKTADTEPQTIIRQSLDQMQKYLTPDLRAAITAQGLTVHQGVILASIVEQEVGNKNPTDQAQVAQVFLKRLRQGMKLESDATTSYGAVLDGQEPHTTYDSVYNTYIHAGLTPGPISNVSKSSLEAVAHPASTDYLFFVAGHDCVTRFSHTVGEHDQLKAQYGVGCKKQ